MRITDILKRLSKIEGINIVDANIGMGIENKLKIKVDEKDYLKWIYFNKKCQEFASTVRIVTKLPYITYVFPRHDILLGEALCSFAQVLDRKYFLIEEPQSDSVTIIAKVTNLCNIDCQYCYDKPFRKKLGHNGILDLEKLDKLIGMAAKHAKTVTIIWHGGEPTLAGVQYYQTIYDDILTKYPYAEFEGISMQSNGTLLNEEWYDLSKEYDMSIGSSYNATQEDLRHTTEDNELGSEKDIHTVLDHVREAEEHGVDIGLIDVMTNENHPRIIEIYEFYKRKKIGVCFNEIHNAGEAEKHEFLFDLKEYGDITTEYFTYWLNDQDPNYYIDRYASENLRLVLSGTTFVCHNGGRCVKNWVAINSNGDLYPCDRALNDKYRIGNVLEFNSMDDMYNTEKYVRYIEERNEKIAKCVKCDMYEYCRGGCPMDDIDTHGSADKANPYACTIKRLNILAAYKALLNSSIEECNPAMKKYFIDNNLIFPKEIPEILEILGLEDEFEDLDFSPENASLKSKEFELFRAFNPIRLIGEDICKNDDEFEDNRITNIVNKMKARANEISTKFAKNHKKQKIES